MTKIFYEVLDEILNGKFDWESVGYPQYNYIDFKDVNIGDKPRLIEQNSNKFSLYREIIGRNSIGDKYDIKQSN